MNFLIDMRMQDVKREDKVFKELFGHTDSILIIDVNGKVLYYEDFNDRSI